MWCRGRCVKTAPPKKVAHSDPLTIFQASRLRTPAGGLRGPGPNPRALRICPYAVDGLCGWDAVKGWRRGISWMILRGQHDHQGPVRGTEKSQIRQRG